MRLTLDACETGHLVLATLHSSTVVEALQRIVSAFPAEEQPSVCAQLADVLHRRGLPAPRRGATTSVCACPSARC